MARSSTLIIVSGWQGPSAMRRHQLQDERLRLAVAAQMHAERGRAVAAGQRPRMTGTEHLAHCLRGFLELNSGSASP